MRLFPLFVVLFLSASFVWAQPEVGKKTSADPAGLEDAKKDIESLKSTLRKKTSAQLVKAFIADRSPRKFGGYEYFYNYMANRAIREELARRGADAAIALRENSESKVNLWQAVNGPRNYTVGAVCSELLKELEE